GMVGQKHKLMGLARNLFFIIMRRKI
ncbi:MAG: hypothetical protein H6R31_430, partial [Methanomicrobia archaeon]|nr:hypothetical protein [Methanomicrobia archaeon]